MAAQSTLPAVPLAPVLLAEDLLAAGAMVGGLLKARRQTIAVAESSTAGLISAALLAQAGASAYFQGGAVVYTANARRALLDIPDGAMSGIRSASEPYARLLAGTVRRRFAADWGLAETGATGPTGNLYGDAAGHSCFGIAGSGPGGAIERAITLETGSPDRLGNMHVFARTALEMLAEELRRA